jgi:hypothetical protein
MGQFTRLFEIHTAPHFALEHFHLLVPPVDGEEEEAV